MQELMNMNYGGNMNRGYGGAPQPQRPNNRRNRGGGGPGGLGGLGGPGFRNSRFEHNNQQQNRPQQQQQQVNRPDDVKPQKTESPVTQANAKPPTPTVAKPPVPEAAQKPQPQAVTQTPPAKPAQTPPQPQQMQAKPSTVNQTTGPGNQGNTGTQGNTGNQGNTGPNRNQNAGPGNQGTTAPNNRNQNPGLGNQGNQNAGLGNQGNTGPSNQANTGPHNRNQTSGPGNQGNTGPNNRNQNAGPGNQGNAGLDNRNQMNSGPDNRNQMNMGTDNRNQMNSGFDNSNPMNSGPGKRSFGGPGGNFGGNKQGGNFGGQNRQGGNFNPGNKQGGPPGGGQPRNQRGGPRGPGDKMGGPMHGAREEHMLAAKLKDLGGPLIDLPPLDQNELKFNGRSRLYIGNLPNDITEEEIQEMFSAFGETSELFLNKEKNFGFIRMDYRATAEKAKRELDGTQRRGRPIKVRFAPHNSAVRVRNLTPFVTNELLYRAFEIFGKIERAYVKVDERGKSLNEGVVEYARKASALAAIRNCTEKCFFLTSSLRPVIVESFEEPEEYDGYQEKNLPKKHPDFMRSREMGPRFSELSSFEHEYGTRWKQLHELYRQKEEALKAERSNEEDKLEAQMEYAKYEHETEILREQLRQREQDRERQKRSWEMAERAAEERREADRVSLARQEEELALRMRTQDDELRRRQQENTLFVQAQRLNSMLDRQEQGIFDSHTQQQTMKSKKICDVDGNLGRKLIKQECPQTVPITCDGGGYMDQYQDVGRRYEDMVSGQQWEGARHQDDFQNKRRRF